MPKNPDPRTVGPKPPFPQQPQSHPGSVHQMNPKADHGEESYSGTGKLTGQVAIVTGADSGIGRATAIAFAREGADLVLSYLKEEETDARSCRSSEGVWQTRYTHAQRHRLGPIRTITRRSSKCATRRARHRCQQCWLSNDAPKHRRDPRRRIRAYFSHKCFWNVLSDKGGTRKDETGRLHHQHEFYTDLRTERAIGSFFPRAWIRNVQHHQSNHRLHHARHRGSSDWKTPGAQLTPFEFVLIFVVGGISIQAVVGQDHSLINVFLSVGTVAMMHVLITYLKEKFPKFGIIVDGSPVLVFENGKWHEDRMRHLGLKRADVLAAARGTGLEGEQQIKYAVVERNGEISIIKEAA